MNQTRPISSTQGHKTPVRKDDVNLIELVTLPGKLATRGLALDEAILATAMVGSMGVFGVAVVPWDTVFSSEYDQVVSQLEQIEQANIDFYATHNRWTYQMTNGADHNNAAALVTQQALRFPFSNVSNYTPLLNDIPYDIQASGITLRHSYGEGGVIGQRKSSNRGYEMEVVLQDVPYSILEALDIEIDGTANLNAGRIQRQISGKRLDLVYYANPKTIASR